MWLSIIVYTTTALAFFAIGMHAARREQRLLATTGKHLPFYSWEIIASVLLFATVAGLRYGTGYDHLMYLSQYNYLSEGHNIFRDFEPGFVWLMKILARNGVHYFFFFALCAALQMIMLLWGIRHNKRLMPWMGLLLMTNYYFLYFMNTIREGIVASFLVASVPALVNRKWIIPAILALIFGTLHKSAYFLFPLTALLCVVRWKELSRRWHLAIFLMMVIIGAMPWWQVWVMKAFRMIAPTVGYGYYVKTINEFIATGGHWPHIGPNSLAGLLIKLILIWTYPLLRAHYTGDRYLPYFFLLFFVGACSHNLLVNTDHYILRLLDSFLLCTLPLTAYLLNYLWQTRRRWALTGMLALCCSYIYIEVFKSTFYPTKVNLPVIYHFFLNPNL